MREDHKNSFSLLITLAISIIFTIIFFSSRDLFSNNQFLYIDHGFFLSYSTYYGDFLFLKYFSSYGPLHYLYCGAPFPPLYPSAQLFCVELIHLLGFSYSDSYKTFLFLTMVFIGTSPYLFSRKLELSSWASVFSSLWFWIGMESFYLTRFSTGSIQYHIASVFAILFLIDINKTYINRTIERDFSKSVSKNSLLLFLAVSFNYMSGIFILIYITIKIILEIIKIKKISRDIMYFMYFIFIICVFTIGLYGYWLIPNLFIHFPNGGYPLDYFLYTKEYGIEYNTRYLMRHFLDLFLAIIIIGFSNKFEVKKGFGRIFMRDLFLMSILTVFIFGFLDIPFFWGVNSYRNLSFLEFSLSIIMGFAFSIVISSIPNNLKLTKVLKVKDQKIEKTRMVSFFYLLILLISFTDIYPNSLFKSSFINPLTDIENKASGWEEDEQLLIDWIKANTTKNYRILFETSGDLSNFQISKGHNMLNLALETDRYYVTGFTHPFFYKFHTLSNYMDGILFGKNVSSYSFEEFYNFSITYNFKFVVCWSNESKQTFQQFHLNHLIFAPIIEINKYTIFEIKNASESYVITNPEAMISEFEYTQNYLKFSLEWTDQPQDYSILISLHDYPNWNVYVDGKKIEKITNALGLIKLKAKEVINKRIDVMIRWEITNVEVLSNFLSISIAVVYIINLFHPKIIEQLLLIFSKKIAFLFPKWQYL